MKDFTPVFVHAWWRSSSTYVWSKLRANPSLCCYYEPLYEGIAKLAGPDAPQAVPLRHTMADPEYFAEYFQVPGSPIAKYAPELAYDRYVLQPDEAHPVLHGYLSGLVTAASEAGRRPVLCFCRSQMRSAWMKRQLGGLHVAQIRNPVSQWNSFQVLPYFTHRMIVVGRLLFARFPGAFTHIHAFDGHPTGSVDARNASALPKFQISHHDAVRLFLLLWLASSVQAVAQADRVLDVDRLSTDPRYRETVTAWFDDIGCAVDFADCATPPDRSVGRWGAGMHALVDQAVDAIRTHAACLVSGEVHGAARHLADLSPVSGAIVAGAIGHR